MAAADIDSSGALAAAIFSSAAVSMAVGSSAAVIVPALIAAPSAAATAHEAAFCTSCDECV